MLGWPAIHRILPRTTSRISGPFNIDRTPYLIEIAEVLDLESGYEEVVFVKPSQVGGSEIGMNLVGTAISEGAGPIAYLMPTLVKARKFAKKRITPMIDLSEDLSSKLVAGSSGNQGKDKDQHNSIMEKTFIAATLSILGANNADSMKADPYRVVVMDEITSYPRDVDDEGDPVELMVGRTTTFGRMKKIFYNSSPGLKRTDRTWAKYLESDQRFPQVPCPLCRHYQELKLERVQYTADERDPGRYRCESCQGLIEHHQKTFMIHKDQLKWVARYPGRKIAGFNMNALYAPIGIGNSWGDIARRFEKVANDTLKLKAFTNTVLGLPWDDSEDVVEWESLYQRKERYPAAVPDDVRLITMGVDVQKRYLAYEILGWTPDRRSYSLEYEELPGDTAEDDVWDRLAEAIQKPLFNQDGIELGVALAAIDTGFRSERVYQFIRKQDIENPNVVHAIDGRSGPDINYYVGTGSLIDINLDGQKIRSGLKVLPVGTHIIKSEIYSQLRLKLREDGTPPPGYCHFPEHYDERYFEMLTAEQLRIIETPKGERYGWVKVRRRNEALDTRVYARAMAYLWGLDSRTKEYWDDINRRLDRLKIKKER